MSRPPTPTDPEEDELLAMLAAGEIAPTDPRAQSYFSRNSAAATRWTALSSVAGALDQTPEAELAELAHARLEVTHDDRELVKRSAQAQLVPARRSRSTWPRVAAAALVVLGVGALMLLNRKPAGSDAPVMMSSGSMGLLAPVGEVTSFDEFRWEGQRGLNIWYEVTVWGESGEGDEVARSGRLDATTWKPKHDARVHWPDRIRWEVVRGSGNSPGASLGVAEARRLR